MNAIKKFLSESYPNNPFDVVIKNKHYPQGIREIDIYGYWMDHRMKILNWVGDRNVAFRIRIDEKSTVIRRKLNGRPIKLTKTNFKEIMTGRTNVIYVEHPSMTDYFVIDIDAGQNLGMKHVAKTANFLLKEFGNKYELLTSSTRSLHYIGYVNKKQNINQLREKLFSLLEQKVEVLNGLPGNINYTVNVKGRKTNTINFDLSTMYDKSLHIARYSLTKEFLSCDIPKLGLRKAIKKKA
jgi:hypothetical protein